MAKSQKTKTEIEEPSIPEVVAEPTVEQPAPEVVEEVAPSDEFTFLCHLLDVQTIGGWHGPAVGLIKERIAQLKGK